VHSFMLAGLKSIQPAWIGLPYNSPIKIDREGAITCEVVHDFMRTKTNKILIDCRVADIWHLFGVMRKLHKKCYIMIEACTIGKLQLDWHVGLVSNH
jgi:hypothetical protein